MTVAHVRTSPSKASILLAGSRQEEEHRVYGETTNRSVLCKCEASATVRGSVVKAIEVAASSCKPRGFMKFLAARGGALAAITARAAISALLFPRSGLLD
jgi:hypothetical protein